MFVASDNSRYFTLRNSNSVVIGKYVFPAGNLFSSAAHSIKELMCTSEVSDRLIERIYPQIYFHISSCLLASSHILSYNLMSFISSYQWIYHIWRLGQVGLPIYLKINQKIVLIFTRW